MPPVYVRIWGYEDMRISTCWTCWLCCSTKTPLLASTVAKGPRPEWMLMNLLLRSFILTLWNIVVFPSIPLMIKFIGWFLMNRLLRSPIVTFWKMPIWNLAGLLRGLVYRFPIRCNAYIVMTIISLVVFVFLNKFSLFCRYEDNFSV